MGEFFEQELHGTMKKSGMCARSAYDFARITDRRGQFLDCEKAEGKETVDFYYDLKERKSLQDLRGEKKINRLRALLEVRQLAPLFMEYQFSLNPANLYYDRNYRIFVKQRDVYEKGVAGDGQDMLAQYKALIGHVMQDKYDFEDYYLGGKDLYKKNSFLKKLGQMTGPDEVAAYLREEFDRAEDAALHKRVEVNKAWYRLNIWYTAATIILIAAAGLYIAYTVFILMPRKDALLSAANSYLDGNYVQVIDDLESVDMRYMDKYQKYMLAVSYVKSESLTPQQKENILETISIDGEEKIKDYWISLGRLDTAEAENIAMQRSDDELLLYAYMTEKAILEKNTELTGEEKADKLADLTKKIEDLSGIYEETNETK